MEGEANFTLWWTMERAVVWGVWVHMKRIGGLTRTMAQFAARTLIVGRVGIKRASGLLALFDGRRNVVGTFTDNTGKVGSGGNTTADLLACTGFTVGSGGKAFQVCRTAPVTVFFNTNDSVRILALSRCFYRLSTYFTMGNMGGNRFLHLVLGSLRFLAIGGHFPPLVGTVARLEVTVVSNCTPGLVTYSGYNGFRSSIVFFGISRNVLLYDRYRRSNGYCTTSGAVVSTVQRVICSSFEGLCGFRVPGSGTGLLSRVASTCLLARASRHFGALSFCGDVGRWGVCGVRECLGALRLAGVLRDLAGRTSVASTGRGTLGVVPGASFGRIRLLLSRASTTCGFSTVCRAPGFSNTGGILSTLGHTSTNTILSVHSLLSVTRALHIVEIVGD